MSGHGGVFGKGFKLLAIIFLLQLNPTSVQAAYCDRLLMHGHAYNGYNFYLGVFDKLGTYGGAPYWKNPQNLYVWLYYGMYWMLSDSPGSLDYLYSYCYLAGGSSVDPGACVGWIAPGVWSTIPEFQIECEDSEHMVYDLRFGFCPNDDDHITEIVTTGYYASQQDCESACDNEPTCVGYSYSKMGCFPRSKTCPTTATMADYYQFEYTKVIYGDLLLEKPTYQSSLHPDWTEGTSARAVDGILNYNMLADPYCSHTNKETSPWWAVEVSPPKLIETIWIKSRGDCCGDRMNNIRILLGNNGTFTENQARIESKQFTETQCTLISSMPAGFRVAFNCEPPAVANYILLTPADPDLETILNLCEVEAAGVDVSQYYLFNTAVKASEAEETCTALFGGGYPVQIADSWEWSMVEDFIYSVQGESGNCLNRARKGTRIGNTAANGDFIDPVLFEGNYAKNGANIAVYTHGTTCQASSEVSSTNTPCDSAIDHDLSTGWASYSEGTGAWIQLTFRYAYPVSMIHILQDPDANFATVHVDFSTGDYIDDNPMPVDVSRWGMIPVNPVIDSEWIQLTGGEVRTEGDTGFTEIRVWAVESASYAWRDGDCPDDTYNTLYYVEAMECQNACTAEANCAGAVYIWSGTDMETCFLKSAICTEEDTVADSEAVIFYKSTTNAGTMRNGDCAGYDISGSQAVSPAGCMELCLSVRYCVTFLYIFTSGTCYTKYRTCDKLSSQSTGWMFIDINTIRGNSSDGLDNNYVGCFESGQDLPVEISPSVSGNVECLDLCENAGYSYAGTSNVDDCRCGEMFGKYGDRRGWGSGCASVCGSEYCGHSGSSSVYSVSTQIEKTCLHMSIYNHPVWEAGLCDEGLCLLCERDYDGCESNPCQNNATCIFYENYFNCTCVPGFTGELCETEVDECESIPCYNGATCVDEIDGYYCECLLGYIGEYCETDYDECQDDPCENEATCVEGTGDYDCVCVIGYTGHQCESEIDECSSTPCQNSGVCHDWLGEYNCTCLPGYDGYNCQIDVDECASDPCINGGTCHDLVNEFSCDCHNGYAGYNCSEELDECASEPCLHGGTCTDLLNSYTCACVPGYTGIYCEQDIDECAGNPCSNHIECMNLVGDFYCDCLPGFGGVTCDTFIGNPGEWTPWSNYSSCSYTCGAGVRFRTRECVAAFPELGQGTCSGPSHDSIPCNLGVCPPVDGSWGSWTPISECNAEGCGPGTWLLGRECDSPPPQYGGGPCEGITQKMGLCVKTVCPNYDRGEWSDWSECGESCGSQSRTRECREDSTSGSVISTSGTSSNQTETETRKCDQTSCSNIGTFCHVCDVAFSSTSSVPQCLPGRQLCSGGEESCMTSYETDGDILKLRKSCGTEAACKEALTSQERRMCLRLLAKADLYQTESCGTEGSTSSIDDSAIIVWRHLTEKCSVCCKGEDCNQGLLPFHGTEED